MPIISLDDAAVRSLAPMPSVISAVQKALVELADRAFEQPQRLSAGNGGALVMPIFHRPSRSTVTKILSLDPKRDPFINGVVSWTADGLENPIVADAVSVTTLRTGAITGVAVDLLARNDVATLTIFGAGAQSFDQVRAVLAVRDIKEVVIVSRIASRAAATAAVLEAEFPGVKFRSTDDGLSTLRNADIVVCATTATTPLFQLSDLADDALVAAIGSYRPDMHEFPQGLIASGCNIYVDSIEACMLESGELISAVTTGITSVGKLIPLARAIVDGAERGKRCIFKSVGIAAQDWAAMKVIDEAIRDAATNSLPLEVTR